MGKIFFGNHLKRLIRLLSIALRVMCLTGIHGTPVLAGARRKLDNIYAGNPKRATAKPTTEMMLRAFCGLNLIVFNVNGTDCCWLMPLNAVQARILALLGFRPPSIKALGGGNFVN